MNFSDTNTINERVRSKDAAQLLLVAEVTLRKSRTTGVLCGRPAPVFIRMGRTILYESSELERWISDLPKGNSTMSLV